MTASVAARIAERLVEQGVRVVFTVPGEQIDALLGELANAGVRLVHTRHEQAASMMAYGYARSTGRIGVFACVSGPGVLYSSAGLALGYAGDARMLCLAGQIAVPAIGRGHGLPHELPDQLGILQRLTGWAARVECPRQTDAVLAQAFHRLRHGRPRPVAVELPADVLTAPAAAAQPWQARQTDRAPDPEALRRAAELLAAAEHPLVFVGSGARGAAPEAARIAELLGAPVTCDTGGRGIVPDGRDPAIPLHAAHRLWPQVDVLLAVGTRLMRPQLQWGLDDRLKVIRIDLDPAELDRVRAPAVGIVADAAETLRELTARLPAGRPRERWRAQAARARRDSTAESGTLAPQLEFLAALREALPADGFFVEELTQIGLAARIAFPVTKPSSYVISTYQECLGFGFATALGVQVANPDRPVLSVSGDGGFLYTCNELATAVLHRLPVVAVVFTDGAFGNVARSQHNRFGFTVATELHNPHFALLAQSFGAHGVRVKTPAELGAAIRTAFTHGGTPTVIEVPVGEMPTPWPLLHRPRVR